MKKRWPYFLTRDHKVKHYQHWFKNKKTKKKKNALVCLQKLAWHGTNRTGRDGKHLQRITTSPSNSVKPHRTRQVNPTNSMPTLVYIPSTSLPTKKEKVKNKNKPKKKYSFGHKENAAIFTAIPKYNHIPFRMRLTAPDSFTLVATGGLSAGADTVGS